MFLVYLGGLALLIIAAARLSDCTERGQIQCWKALKSFFDLKLSHWITLSLTGALLYVGWSQLSVYTKQEQVMTKQAAIMATQAGIATTANKQNSIVNRAFVSPAAINFDGPHSALGNGSDWTTIITWGNTGNTPTRNLQMVINYDGFTDLQKWPKFPTFDKVELRGSFLGPRASTVMTIPVPMNILARVQRKDLYLYIFGRATYQDVINGDTHITRACWELFNVPADISGNTTTQTFLPQCAIHNCADEECAREDREHPEAAP